MVDVLVDVHDDVQEVGKDFVDLRSSSSCEAKRATANGCGLTGSVFELLLLVSLMVTPS